MHREAGFCLVSTGGATIGSHNCVTYDYLIRELLKSDGLPYTQGDKLMSFHFEIVNRKAIDTIRNGKVR